jgi:hypothetical protein
LAPFPGTAVLRALSFKLAHKEKPIMTPKRLMQAVVLAPGWRRAWIAFIAGAASALCQAPTNVWPILFLTFPLLVWLIDGAPAQDSTLEPVHLRPTVVTSLGFERITLMAEMRPN